MTKQIGSLAAGKVVQRITASAAFDATQIRTQNAAADLAERGEPVVYPAVNVYCEKIVNGLTEKFRRFSGTLQMGIEVRHSQDRLAGLQDRLEVSVDSLMQTLDTARGDWGDGMYYAGGYQAAFTAAKQGGKNYLQTAKITFEIGVSIS
ncbi:MAG TPA: hypothetical protein VG456_22045 [Candidatus Sulfopaludibacter sp.]|jgi:hypothetical protein|nr:hypothetical protein [Candidatus Sulfopaludibacter sp.]